MLRSIRPIVVALSGSLAFGLAAAPAAHAFERPFKTPSSAIYCAYLSYPDLGTPPQIRCDMTFLNDRAVVLRRSGKARKVKVTDTVGNPSAPALAYGTSKRFGVFTCTSRRTGLTCVRRGNGHGFSISKESQKVY